MEGLDCKGKKIDKCIKFWILEGVGGWICLKELFLMKLN